jgi:cyclopropane fatty-acyl-phospholipid synthase-like methyltransferase
MPSDVTIRSNVQYWQELQSEGYFENHPCYDGIKEAGGEECLNAIARFTELDREKSMAVIGCGYGRESLKLSREVAHIYGIDVSEDILDKARKFLGEHGVTNFTGVLHENYKRDIPAGLDLVFSIVVMQHLTRDLVQDYFSSLADKLKPGGAFVVQFLEELFEGVDTVDAELKKYEPSISWTIRQLVQLSAAAKLDFIDVHTQLVTPTALWHWAYFRKPIGAPQTIIPPSFA